MRETNRYSVINFSLIRIMLNNQSNISLIFDISINMYFLRIITSFLTTFLGTIIDGPWTNDRWVINELLIDHWRIIIKNSMNIWQYKTNNIIKQ